MDADFLGGCSQEVVDSADNVVSRTIMVITYANCLVYWCRSLQTDIELSAAKAECIALSSALREVLPLMTMMEGINEVFPLHISKPKFVYKVHENN